MGHPGGIYALFILDRTLCELALLWLRFAEPVSQRTAGMCVMDDICKAAAMLCRGHLDREVTNTHTSKQGAEAGKNTRTSYLVFPD